MFSAANNALTGIIPTSLLLRNMWYIRLNHNALTGSIPKSSESMNYLRELLLHDNSLTGDFIPQNGGFYTGNQTYHDNYIHGKVDPDICAISYLMVKEFELTADCLPSFLECSCCTKCYDGKRVTVVPSPTPTLVPSSNPSLSIQPSVTCNMDVVQRAAILTDMAFSANPSFSGNDTITDIVLDWLLVKDDYNVCPKADNALQRYTAAIVSKRLFPERTLTSDHECSWLGFTCNLKLQIIAIKHCKYTYCMR